MILCLTFDGIWKQSLGHLQRLLLVRLSSRAPAPLRAVPAERRDCEFTAWRKTTLTAVLTAQQAQAAYFTSSQTDSHFFLQVNGLLHVLQILLGKSALLGALVLKAWRGAPTMRSGRRAHSDGSLSINYDSASLASPAEPTMPSPCTLLARIATTAAFVQDADTSGYGNGNAAGEGSRPLLGPSGK